MVRPRKDGTTSRDDPPTKHAHIAVYADIALRMGYEGIKVNFNYVDFPSAETCRQALVRFRSSFGALKAKDRRYSIRYGQPPKYEDIGCYFEKTDEGWVACIRSNHHFVSAVTEANGEPVREFLPGYEHWRRLNMQATMTNAKTCIFSQEDEDFFWDFDPETAEIVYKNRGWKPPTRELEDE